MILATLLCLAFPPLADSRTTPAIPFKTGEVIRFNIRVFNTHVGQQVMHFKGPVTVDGRQLLYAVADTRSLPSITETFNYTLHDVMHVWMDPATLLPVRIRKDISEGDWKNDIRIEIDQQGKQAVYFDKRNKDGKKFTLQRPTLDILSLVYFVRAHRARPGEVIDTDYLADDKGVKRVRIHVKQGEPMKLANRTIPTLYFEQDGGEKVRIRMTDDERRIPLGITVGTFQIAGYTIDIVGSLVSVEEKK
jgi:hypothetical protein